MLKVTKPDTNRLDIILEGTLDAEKMRDALDHLVDMSADINAGKMLYKIKNFHLPTMGAIGVEFGYMPKLFSLIGRFDKCAVCSDIGWVRTAAAFEGALIPGLEIKTFGLDETAAAEAWLDA